METLADNLLTRIGKLDQNDPEWVLFVRDFRHNILANSKVHQLRPGLMQSHRFRLGSLLEELGVDKNISWIVMELNSLRNMRDVDGLTSLTIPTNDYMLKLYAKYTSFKKKIEKQ